jgi:hypothetical protein
MTGRTGDVPPQTAFSPNGSDVSGKYRHHLNTFVVCARVHVASGSLLATRGFQVLPMSYRFTISEMAANPNRPEGAMIVY